MGIQLLLGPEFCIHLPEDFSLPRRFVSLKAWTGTRTAPGALILAKPGARLNQWRSTSFIAWRIFSVGFPKSVAILGSGSQQVSCGFAITRHRQPQLGLRSETRGVRPPFLHSPSPALPVKHLVEWGWREWRPPAWIFKFNGKVPDPTRPDPPHRLNAQQ